eukprot:scaffold27929_cov176-Amphora_coffeaeformis.AAC.4
MSLRLDQRDTADIVHKCLEEIEWPVFARDGRQSRSILDVVLPRRDHLLQSLPYHYLPVEPSAGPLPSPRNGHAAASFPETDTMYIIGGTDGNNVLGDVWKVDLTTATWHAMTKMPKGARHAFSAHPWTS